MSVSLHIVAYRPADEEWNKMKLVWETCTAAGVPVPEKVQQFFEYDEPRDKPGQEIPMTDALMEWEDDYRQGYEIDLSKLPSGIRYIRAYLS